MLPPIFLFLWIYMFTEMNTNDSSNLNNEEEFKWQTNSKT